MNKEKTKAKDTSPNNINKIDSHSRINLDEKDFLDTNRKVKFLEKQMARRTAELTSVINLLNREISSHQRDRKSIIKSERQYREIFNSILDGICITDNNENIQFCNPAFANIFEESSPAALIQKNLLDYLKKDQIEMVLSQTERRKKNIASQYDLEVVTARGNKKQLYVSAVPRFNNEGQYIGAFGSVLDITRRKSDEIRLKESEEKFRGLSEQSPNMIFINCHGRIVYVNRQCVDIMGYTKSEFYSSDFDFRCLIAPESLDELNKRFAKYLEGIGSPPIEYAIITKSGKRIEAILSTKIITYEGQPAILGIITDITKYKKAERSLINLNLELKTQQAALLEKNITLKEVLNQIEGDKKNIGIQIQSNIDKTILPILGRMLEKAGTDDKRDILLMQNSLSQVTHPFVGKLESLYGRLTPREAEICNMIKIGLNTKEIANSLNTSWETVRNQRKQIRKKLNIKGKKVSLTSLLQST